MTGYTRRGRYQSFSGRGCNSRRLHKIAHCYLVAACDNRQRKPRPCRGLFVSGLVTGCSYCVTRWKLLTQCAARNAAILPLSRTADANWESAKQGPAGLARGLIESASLRQCDKAKCNRIARFELAEPVQIG